MGKEIFRFFNVMIVYYGLQLVRCALFSYVQRSFSFGKKPFITEYF